MSIHGHNGGPPLIEDDDGDIRMRFARIHISDFLNGIKKMPLEARGFYVTGLFCMYDNMGSLPADDRMAALQMNCNIRTYQRLRAMMTELNAFGDNRVRWVDTGEGLSNKRVQDEIADYCREFRNRRDAALQREAGKKRARDAEDKTIGPIAAQVEQPIGPIASEKQPEIAPLKSELADTFPASEATKTELRADLNELKIELKPASNRNETAKLSEKSFEINDGTTTAVPEHAPQSTPQNGGHPKHKHKQKEESEEQCSEVAPREVAVTELQLPPQKIDQDALERELLAACNGALENPANCVGLLNLSTPLMWLERGADLQRDVLATLRARSRAMHNKGKRVGSWDYFTNAVLDALAKRRAGVSLSAGGVVAASDEARHEKNERHAAMARAMLAAKGVI